MFLRHIRNLFCSPEQREIDRLNGKLHNLLDDMNEQLDKMLEPFKKDRECLNCSHHKFTDLSELCSPIVCVKRRKIVDPQDCCPDFDNLWDHQRETPSA